METWQIILIVTCVAVLLVVGAFLAWRYGASFLRPDKARQLPETSGAVEMTPAYQGAPPGWFQGAPAYPNQGAPPAYYNQGAPQNFA